ncbi:MAG: hypothetical protein KatS3mg111_0519 [Pirellulaceae bacterium]|nr:MAG: hypothetical protein KatS3mg111_0519 [Pirellulaceae bacterium]
MARAFSGVLGVLAFSFIVLRGVYANAPADQVLAHGLVVFFLFSLLGFVIGWMAEKTVRESVENRFRMEMAHLQSVAAGDQSEDSAAQD